MEEIQIDDVQKMLDEIMDDHVFSVREALMNIINGEEPVSKETVRSFLYSLFFSDIENEKGLILKLFTCVFLLQRCWRSLLMFSETAGWQYQLLYCLSCAVYNAYGEFLKAWKYAYKLASWTDGFHESSFSGYFMTVAASTGSSTAAAFYEGILLMIWAVQWLLANLFLPAVNLSLLLKNG